MAAHRRRSRKNRRARIAVAVLALVLTVSLVTAGGFWLVPKFFGTGANVSGSSVPSVPLVTDPSAGGSSSDDTTVRPVATATIGNMGDILIHSPLLTAAKQGNGYSFDNIFSEIAPYAKACDLSTINLELSLPGDNYSSYPRFRTPDSLVDSLLSHGFGLVTTANNHSNDGGASGFLRTMEVLKEKGMAFIGTRPTVDDKNYLVKEINGIKIGMINYTYGSFLEDGRKSLNGIPCTTATTPLVNMFSAAALDAFYAEMQESIKQMRADGAEVLVAYMHWGNEYRLSTTSTQRTIAQKLCDFGVDVIVGGHPHVVEPAEVLTSDISGKSTLCVYSMGNAVSNQRIQYMDDIKTGHTEDGLFFSFTFTKYSDGSVKVTDAQLLPTWVHMYTENGRRVYQIVPLDKSKDFSTSFGLSKSASGVKNAEKSYDRTMALVGDGIEAFEAFFASQQQALDALNNAA